MEIRQNARLPSRPLRLRAFAFFPQISCGEHLNAEGAEGSERITEGRVPGQLEARIFWTGKKKDCLLPLRPAPIPLRTPR